MSAECTAAFLSRRCFRPLHGGKQRRQGNPRNAVAPQVEQLAREERSEQTRTRSGLSRSEQTGTRSDGVAVSGDMSPESVRRFSRSANPKGAEVVSAVRSWTGLLKARRSPELVQGLTARLRKRTSLGRNGTFHSGGTPEYVPHEFAPQSL